MRDAEYLGNFQSINSANELGSLPDTFFFAETFQRDVVPGRTIGLFITEDIEVKRVSLDGDVLTLSVGGMVFMVHSNEFQYPFEVRI